MVKPLPALREFAQQTCQAEGSKSQQDNKGKGVHRDMRNLGTARINPGSRPSGRPPVVHPRQGSLVKTLSVRSVKTDSGFVEPQRGFADAAHLAQVIQRLEVAMLGAVL